MKILIVTVSAVTAFAITAGGSMCIAFIATHGAMPDKVVWYSAVCLGIVSAAKDTRSLLKLPPVTTPNQNNP